MSDPRFYDYYAALEEDVREYIKENIEFGKFTSKEELADALDEECWVADSVTGNGSGSYTFSRAKAKEYVIDNMDLLIEAVRDFCIDLTEVANHFLDEDWEWFDVTIRCYLLNGVIWQVVESLELPYDD